MKTPTLIVAALAAVSLGAQTAPAPAPTAPANRPIDDGSAAPTVLSPFEVVEDTRGYHAMNTMSGTRMNSKLEDLGSSITVVTKQQMEDLALLDVNDVFAYEAGTEGAGTFSNFDFDRNGNPIDNTSLNPTSSNRMRGVGAANVTFGSFETSGTTPIDPVDIDAVEISRGPNSNIFGIGSAAGTVNTVRASANPRQNRTRISTRVDSYEGYRGSLDVNRVLLKGVLAIRGSAVFQHDGFDLKPSGVDTERYNGMVKFQPFRSTSISGSYAYYHSYGNRPNTTPPREGITGWIAAGRPTWDPVAATATINGVRGLPQPAIFRVFPGASNLVSVDRGGITYLTPNRSTIASTPVTMNGARQLLMADRTTFLDNQPLIQDFVPVRDKSLYDWTSLNLAASNFSDTRTQISSVLYDQILLRSERQQLTTQLGWFREDVEAYTRNFVGPGNASGFGVSVLQVDINERRLDGSANPDFLRPFYSVAGPQYGTTSNDRHTYRGQFAYRLDLTKEKNLLRWLGRHDVSGYVEYKHFITKVRRYRDAIVSDHGWLTPGLLRGTDGTFAGFAFGSRFTQANYRFYVGDNQGNNADYGVPNYTLGTYPLNWGNAQTGVWTNEPTTWGSAVSGPTGGNANQKTTLRTQGAVLQSHFLDGRIVTTLGIRNDSRYTKDGRLVVVNNDGITIDEPSFHRWVDDWNLGEGKTKTAGVVVKPLRWFSVYYNQSDSFRPQPPRQDIFRQPLPDPTGDGKDYGVMLNLFQGKLFVRANVYETNELSSRAGQAGTLGTRTLIIDRPEIPGQNGAPPAFQLQAHATRWIQAAATARGETLTQQQTIQRVADLMKLPLDFFDPYGQTSSTSDITAKGKEIELAYNPTASWTMKLNVTEQISINSQIARDVAKWVAERMPVWTSIIDPTTGRPWFTERYENSNSASQYLTGSVNAPLALERATEGLSRPQVRKYRLNYLTSYRLAAVSDQRWLKRMTVGGAVRWEDKGAIGFWGVEQLPAEITRFDPNRPIYDKARYYVDAFVTYRTKLFSEKVNTSFQLNVRNLGERGRLQPIAADPHGAISAYRIVSPQQFIFTANFEL